jgi:peptidyl-prolyl cis-trans isomerase-like 3
MLFLTSYAYNSKERKIINVEKNPSAPPFGVLQTKTLKLTSSPLHSLQSVTLHTTLGDLKLEIYCEEVPRTATSFLAHCASGYYDKTIFHRNIKGFMIQGGDPTGTGKGGVSIYNTPNGKFQDEIVDSLKHSRRGIVSMANSGPNSNGSQFFVTYKAHTHLNGKNSWRSSSK